MLSEAAAIYRTARTPEMPSNSPHKTFPKNSGSKLLLALTVSTITARPNSVILTFLEAITRTIIAISKKKRMSKRLIVSRRCTKYSPRETRKTGLLKTSLVSS